MLLIEILVALFFLSSVDLNIYIYSTLDSSSLEFYDCIYHEKHYYCRRPTEPIVLNRSNNTIPCYNEGIAYTFAELLQNNINFSTIVHKWKSSIESAERYAHYLNDSNNQTDGYVCNCINPRSFGKHCEYLLPFGSTFSEAIKRQYLLKEKYSQYVQLYGDTICYTTLKCNSGLLCLDWREICDGLQQCMSGVDEENCDKLEFNECEKDEYRCMNGMCIPEGYVFDGQYDCLDWSDELQYYDDGDCPLKEPRTECDDRICPPNQFSCGDGQCIIDRFDFQIMQRIKSECRSRREQNFVCETHFIKDMWTLPNGRCYEFDGSINYNLSNFTNQTKDERCVHILQCDLSGAVEAHCPCGSGDGDNYYCDKQFNESCSSNHILFPQRGIMAPYILFYYPRFYQLRPNHTLINGTIKCNGREIFIPGIQFPFKTKLRDIEDDICHWAELNSSLYRHETDEDCFSKSLTFDNRSYSAINVCYRSKKCVSTYRINDGFENCAYAADEKTNISVNNICSKLQRYRFHCSPHQPTCLNIAVLADDEINCENKYDEYWLGTNTKLVDINCNQNQTDQCEALRQYVAKSWLSDETKDIDEELRIPFHQYCDTFWHLASKEDENVDECGDWWACPIGLWRCHTGQCIDEKWVLDGEWDCSDASDEENLDYRLNTERNLAIVSQSILANRSLELNKAMPFASICNLTSEFPCFSINISYSVDNLTENRPCIDRYRIGDGRIDCYGGIDERNTGIDPKVTIMLGYNFQCQSTYGSIPYWKHCVEQIDRCKKESDDYFWCDYRTNYTKCNKMEYALCFNGTCIVNGRCNHIIDCPFGEDEYMCDYYVQEKSLLTVYRKSKESVAKHSTRKLQLKQFPSDTNQTKSIAEQNSIASITMAETVSKNETMALVSYWCNRGVGIEMYNGSIVCFCPPQYYGDKCQFHTDRINVIIHFNLTQSIFTADSDPNIVLKILVLFLFNDDVMMNQIFFLRPAYEFSSYDKIITHFIYSHSSQFLEHKQQRYFNRSNIIHDQPYSVRIEVYIRMDPETPQLIAVWKYPIYFDYLPAFRLAKVLRLLKPDMKSNPCSSNPCNRNQDCQPLQNSPSRYICLCKSNFTGEDCSEKDQLCTSGYCAFGSICKPKYRGILTGNDSPYCICLFDRYGERCHLEYDQCLSDPCQNNGSCVTTKRPDNFICRCTDHYHGNNCELKNPEIKLDINQTMPHKAAVLQYFDIDFVQLNLMLVQQQVYHILPTTLEYRHKELTAPEIILVKLYSSFIHHPPQLYLISINVNATTIHATTQLTDNNHCQHIHSLTSINQTHNINNYSPIRYHFFCQNNTDLLCFHDDHYLCICDENHARVECFRYDLKLDECQHCLSGGRCIKGDRSQANKFICLCPSCQSGTKCQFNSNSFAFTLDQLFFLDLTSNHKETTTLQLLIIMPLLMFIIALPNNICSFLTFRRPRCLRNGIGHYLLSMSIINQLNLAFLSSRLIHLAISITGLEFHSHSSIDNYLCKIFNYLLICSSRMVYWLSSLVAIERLYMTLFLNGQWLRKPHIARYLIIFIVISNLLGDIHELIFVKSVSDVHNEKDSMCVIAFPLKSQSTWLLYHRIISIINSILPLFINMCCTIVISGVVAKKKLNTRQTISPLEDRNKKSRLTQFRTRFCLVWEVLKENKELIVGPGITLVPQLFSLPLFIVSFTFYCQNLESTWIRYPLIVSYFITFIPQLTSFLLYVIPSSFYTTEWRSTKLGQWMIHLFRSSEPNSVTSKLCDTIAMLPRYPADVFCSTLNNNPKCFTDRLTQLDIPDINTSDPL